MQRNIKLLSQTQFSYLKYGKHFYHTVYNFTPKKVDKVILHVARGEQDQAEKMIKLTPQLILQKGSVKDYSNRTFNNITAFQYSAWALDWHMWSMILQYLRRHEAKIQLENLEKNGTEHGEQFSFDELVKTQMIYLEKFHTWDAEQLGKHWCIDIGRAQVNAVAHVANQYCHPNLSFLPARSFTESLPRNLSLIDGSQFFPILPYKAGIMGEDFAVFRWNKPAAGIGTMAPCPNAKITSETDLQALISLRDKRLAQYAELRNYLGLSCSYFFFRK